MSFSGRTLMKRAHDRGAENLISKKHFARMLGKDPFLVTKRNKLSLFLLTDNQ